MGNNGDVLSRQVAPLLEAVVSSIHTYPRVVAVFKVGSKAWFIGALRIQAPVGAISNVYVPLRCGVIFIKRSSVIAKLTLSQVVYEE